MVLRRLPPIRLDAAARHPDPPNPPRPKRSTNARTAKPGTWAPNGARTATPGADAWAQAGHAPNATISSPSATSSPTTSSPDPDHHALPGPNQAVIMGPLQLDRTTTLLDTGNGWISVRTEGGLGAVAEPADPELWAAEVNTTITDLHAGRGIVVQM